MFLRRLSFSTLAYTMCVCDALGGMCERRVVVEGRLLMSIMLSSVSVMALSCIFEDRDEICEDSGA